MDDHSGICVSISCGAVPFPFHFGAYEFHGRKAAAQMGFASFTLHGKGGIMGDRGNAVIIESVIRFLRFLVCFSEEYMLFQRKLLEADIYRFQWSQKLHPQKMFWG